MATPSLALRHGRDSNSMEERLEPPASPASLAESVDRKRRVHCDWQRVKPCSMLPCNRWPWGCGVSAPTAKLQSACEAFDSKAV